MAQFSVTAYFKTGFNGLNIPFSQAVLENAQKKEYGDVYFFREDLDNPYIKLKDTYDNLADVDYIKVVNHNTGRISFFFATPHSEAKQTTGLALRLDALTTLGGAGMLDYSSGWQTDGHISKAEDILFANTVSEDITPVDPLVIANVKKIKPESTSEYAEAEIVITNTDLSEIATLDENEIGYLEAVDPDTGETKITIPKVPMTTDRTGFGMVDPINGGSVNYNIPNTEAYNLKSETVTKALAKMFSLGINGISNSYKIPLGYVKPNEQTDGAFLSLLGVSETQSTGMPFEFGTYKNKKVYAMFRTFNIINCASGDTISKGADELYKSGLTAPSVALWADPSPLGKPYARFTYQNSSDYLYDSACQGSQWCTNQIALEGASGSFWNSANYNFSQKSTIRDYYREKQSIESTPSIENLAGDVQRIGGLGAALFGNVEGDTELNAGYDYAGNKWKTSAANAERSVRYKGTSGKIQYTQETAEQSLNEKGMEFAKSQLQIPEVNFTPQPSLSLYGYNFFMVQEVRPSAKSLQIFDNYFQRFGYRGVNVPLTKECFNKRDYYCYVKAFNISINSNFGMRIREAAINQLNNGVRVWKVLPDAKYYELN